MDKAVLTLMILGAVLLVGLIGGGFTLFFLIRSARDAEEAEEMAAKARFQRERQFAVKNVAPPDNPRFDPNPVILPTLKQIADVKIIAGQSLSVRIEVDRKGGAQGQVDVSIDEQDRLGALPGGGPPGGPGLGGPAVPGMKNDTRGLRIDKRLVSIPADKDFAEVKLSAGLLLDRPVITVRVEVLGRPGDGLAPMPGGGGGAGGPPGGPPGGPGDAPAGGPGFDPLDGRVQTFQVFIERPTLAVLPVLSSNNAQEKTMQLDVIRGAVRGYSYDPTTRKILVVRNRGAGKGISTLAQSIRPGRMVLVTAAFPYKDQLEAWRKTLQLPGVEDLFHSKELTPVFTGLNVQRREVGPDGKPGEWHALYSRDPATGKTVLTPSLQELFSIGVLDEQEASRLDDSSVTGLATPLPMLARGVFPDPQIPGLDLGPRREEMDSKPKDIFPGGPKKDFPFGPPGEIPDDASLDFMRTRDLSQSLRDRLEGKANVFDPFAGTDREAMGLDARPFPGGKEPLGEPRRPAPPAATSKCLVRFLDFGVEENKAYQYSIQVRMADPFFRAEAGPGKPQPAVPRELVSPITLTPSVNIGPDWHFYAVDQKPLETGFKGPLGADVLPANADKVPIQVHRWVDVVRDEEKAFSLEIGDWVIAERLLLDVASG